MRIQAYENWREKCNKDVHEKQKVHSTTSSGLIKESNVKYAAKHAKKG